MLRKVLNYLTPVKLSFLTRHSWRIFQKSKCGQTWCIILQWPIKRFLTLFRSEVKKVTYKDREKNRWWMDLGSRCISVRLSQELVCFPYCPELPVRDTNSVDVQTVVEYFIVQKSFYHWSLKPRKKSLMFPLLQSNLSKNKNSTRERNWRL